MTVIVAAPMWSLNGVNVFSTNLVRGLHAGGMQAHILITNAYPYDPKPMPLPSDIPFERFPVGSLAGWRTRWRAMIRYLEERAPCIYLPNHDFRHSCVSPKLAAHIGIVGIVHGDDAQHYEHAARLGRYWNAIVAVSHAITERTAALNPALTSRLVTIPHGVEILPQPPERDPDENTPLKIVYAGGLTQRLKRALDLPQIASALADRQVPIALTIIGGGTEQQQLIEACSDLTAQGKVKFPGILSNERVLEIMGQNDVFILTSESEGLPLGLLEAMGRGCVPVVTDIRSGIPELVQDGVNGYRVPVGDIQGFVERLALLQQDVALRQELSSRAYHTVRTGGYRTEDMVQNYLDLFERVRREAENGTYHRPNGKILPPPSLTWRDRLPPLIQAMARYGKRMWLKQDG